MPPRHYWTLRVLPVSNWLCRYFLGVLDVFSKYYGSVLHVSKKNTGDDARSLALLIAKIELKGMMVVQNPYIYGAPF